MRREAIPPLRGGAVQALQNIQTTLRDHPNPASRPMTLGHFTSWRADDRGYYTGVGYTPTELGHLFGARMCPAWCNCDIQYMIQRDRERDREQTERETERAELVTFLGQVPGMMGIHNSVTFDSVHDTHEMIRTRKIVGHICGIPGARRRAILQIARRLAPGGPGHEAL